MTNMTHDKQTLPILLEQVRDEAVKFLKGIDSRPPVVAGLDQVALETLPSNGLGAAKALEAFLEKYLAGISASAGPRNFSFVTGGTTPAALAGDWLTSTFDQNTSHFGTSAAAWAEVEALGFIKDLIKLPDQFHGIFVTGATMSNFVGIALGRQWVARKLGFDLHEDGLYGLEPINLLSGSIHSSGLKCLSMLGMGRKSWRLIKKYPGREAMDITDLEAQLIQQSGKPCIVVASAGTVNTGDFDDLVAIAHLQEKYPFWLHIDAAFGGFVRASARYEQLAAGLELGDSVTVDLHKWLNVPYDAGVLFTRHRELQFQVFRNNAAYLDRAGSGPTPFADLGPENSRRFRGLSTWLTLKAYGAEGYRHIVENNIKHAQFFAERLALNDSFRILAPVYSNIVCFALKNTELTAGFCKALSQSGKVFLTPTIYDGAAAVRAAFVNWSTSSEDVSIAADACLEAYLSCEKTSPS